MQINAAAHVLRAARQVGLLDALRDGQQTAEQLIQTLQLRPQIAQLMLDCLTAMGIIEKYGDDYALAAVTRLLCQYDGDLGDQIWSDLPESLRRAGEVDNDAYFAASAATQWIHTPAAMQAAEMLDIGHSRQALQMLDLGCGSAVWSCAMAFRDTASTVTAVDYPAALEAATSTAESIELGDRFRTIAGNPASVPLPGEAFDLVILASRLHAESDERGRLLLQRAREALAPGGEIVIIDLFLAGAKPRLAETIAALHLELVTESGGVRDAQTTQQQVIDSGFRDPQFTYLPASRVNLGMLVAKKG